MPKQIFINLAVHNVQQSMEFYTAMGFAINPQFSDEQGKCMVWSEHIYVMILSHAKFSSFATRPIADNQASVAALYSLSVDDIDQVNTIVNNALAAGGKEIGALKDYGFMQQRSVEDPDGYTWEVFCMDMSKFPAPQ